MFILTWWAMFRIQCGFNFETEKKINFSLFRWFKMRWKNYTNKVSIYFFSEYIIKKNRVGFCVWNESCVAQYRDGKQLSIGFELNRMENGDCKVFLFVNILFDGFGAHWWFSRCIFPSSILNEFLLADSIWTIMYSLIVLFSFFCCCRIMRSLGNFMEQLLAGVRDVGTMIFILCKLLACNFLMQICNNNSIIPLYANE